MLLARTRTWQQLQVLEGLVAGDGRRERLAAGLADVVVGQAQLLEAVAGLDALRKQSCGVVNATWANLRAPMLMTPLSWHVHLAHDPPASFLTPA